MLIKNSQGKIWYGLHFYPGVAEYRHEGKEPERVFLNENTLRKMDSTFQGRPVFVMHVDGVEQDINELRKDADGWVVESFFNESDGKHWVKFITVSDRAESAIRDGMRLSNAYYHTQTGAGGLWNGVEYSKEITNGEYEHLAIVPNPRYEESVIMTPDQFKKYNDDKRDEVKRIANSKSKGDSLMAKFSWFKKEKVENAGSYEALSVVLPESKKEVSIQDLISNADKMEKEKDKPKLVNAIDLVEVNGEPVTVQELVEAYKNMKDCNESDDKKDKGEEGKKENEDEDDDEAMENEDDAEEELKKEEKKEEKKENKKKNSQEKKVPHPGASKLRNAERDAAAKKVQNNREPRFDGVERGKALFGSSK